ncbi:MAG: hypothetical protein OEZ19_00570 [Paracoccaceae bacterium]|nr:hypothetical protein [Paracoccaceae bacterium]
MAFALSAPAWALELVMVEQDGCFWCARWDRDVADIYPKTAEGQSAPLRRMDLHDDIPADLSFAAPLTFTPTFVLVDDGREVARIEGYPGEDFFWGLLARMLQDQAQPAKD